MDETLLPIAEAHEAFPVEVSKKWVEKMIRTGTRGTTLESILIGTRRYTSKEAIRRFITRTQGVPKSKQKVPTVRVDQDRIEKLRKQFNLPASGDDGLR